MTFTYDPNLPDLLSRTRALLLDTDPAKPLFSDEAILNMQTLYGPDEGTAQLALILLNRYGNMPSMAAVEGQRVAWGDRFQAWQQVIEDARAYGMADASAASTGPSRTRPGVYGVQPPDPYRTRAIIPHRGWRRW